METQHKVFPVGAGRDAIAVHVWLSVAGAQIEIHGRHPLPCPALRLPLRTSAGWRETALLCRGVGTGERRKWIGLGVSQGKTADQVAWSVGTVQQNAHQHHEGGGVLSVDCSAGCGTSCHSE